MNCRVMVFLMWSTLAVLTINALSQEEKSEEPEYGWSKEVVANLNFTQSSFDNWTQGGENSWAWLGGLNTRLINDQEKINWTNVGKFEYGQSKIGDDESKKSADEIFIESVEDSVQISFVGFQRQFIDLQSNTIDYTIQLEEKAQLINEVLVMPKDDVYLFDLIKECRKKSTQTEQSAKAYYYLKTYEDNHQIELVEGFYNLDFVGYDLQNLDLKAGRLALQPVNEQFFNF